MKKVFIKSRINEDVAITDPTLAQQYLAVKKQMADKEAKKGQMMKQVNQIDSELGILQKNLIAIETKSATATAKTTTQKPAENVQQPIQTNQPTQGQALESFTKFNNTNESVYSDMISNIEDEISKLTDIKDFINKYDTDDDQSEELPLEISTDFEPSKEDSNVGFFETPIDITSSHEDKNFDNISDEIVDTKSSFTPSNDQKIVDETLKAEDKDYYVPNLVEQEDIETELEMMNYEDEDEPTDEYVFHVRIDDIEEEIIAKIYRDSDDEDWTVRVVKGSEEPLQSMQFDNTLDKLDIIGYIAEIYDEIEIIDHKEYEYLLDDKEKIDTEYYADLFDNEKV